MIGVSLSRWTITYFAAALVAFLMAQILMLAGYGYPNAPIEAPETLVLVHLIALGWLSLLISGALFQFVPVLVAHPLQNDSLPLPTLVLLLGGLAALLLGFLQLSGQIAPLPSLFPVASLLLGTGFGLIIWNLGRTLWVARPLAFPARFVVVGLVSMTATLIFGIIFALILGGATTQASLLTLTDAGIPIHVIAGLGGWLTFTAMGVSYRLLAMFMLAPDLDGWSTQAVFYLGTLALLITIAGGTTAISLSENLNLVLFVAGAFGLAALAFYGLDIFRLYRARKRRNLELNSRMVSFSFLSLTLAVALTVVTLILGNLSRYAGAIVFLLAFGWLSGLGLAKLYKIVAFLTWLECYGPVLGKTPTPRVQDLVTEKRTIKWFLLYFLAAWLGTIALVAGNVVAFRGTIAAMVIATSGIIVQLLRTRRLADVKTTVRLPEGARRPRLLFSLSQRT
jgi:hypothetical protein